MGFKTSIAGAATLLLAVCTPAPAATGDALDNEFAINVTTLGDQSTADIASDAGGRAVAVWTEASDGDGSGVRYRILDAGGKPQSAPAFANLNTAGNQFAARVAMRPSGEFAICWVSTGQDGSGDGVFLRTFAASGAPISAEIAVNQTTLNNQNQPDIAWNGAAYVLTWTGLNQDGNSFGIAARRFSASGSSLGNEFNVNSFTADSQSRSRVAAAPDGRFVIAWQSFGQDGDINGVFAQLYDASGAKVGGEIAVNSVTANSQEQVDVAMAVDGGFRAVWADFNLDGSGSAIALQRFDSTGTALGGRVQINQSTNGNQVQPAIATAVTGSSVIAWEGETQDGDGSGLVFRALASDDAPLTGEIPVNQFTAGKQSAVSASLDADADLRLVWQSAAQDGDGLGVFARAFLGPNPVDLRADLSAAVTRVRPAGPFTLSAGISNLQAPSFPSGDTALNAGVGLGTGLLMNLGLPLDTVMTSSTGGGWVCNDLGGQVACTRAATLAAAANTASSLSMRAPSTVGTHDLVLDVGANEGDETPLNNQQSLNIVVTTPSATLTTDSVSLVEGGSTSLRFRVEPAAGATVQVSYASGGTASLGSDYTIATASPVSVAAESAETVVQINSVDDATHEQTETISVQILSTSGANIGSPSSVSITLSDNDPEPSVQLVGINQTVSETATGASMGISLSGTSDREITVPFTLSGTATLDTDYRISTPSPVRIAAGATSATVAFELLNDLITEEDETLILSLGAPSGASLGTPSSQQILIEDDERRLGPANVRFVLASQSVSEGAATVGVRARLSRALGQTVSIPVSVGGTAVAGADYSLPAASLSFAAGTTEAVFNISLIDDSADEADETLELDLQSSGEVVLASPSRHILIVADNDPEPTMRFDVATLSVPESGQVLRVGVSLSAPSDFAISAGIRVSGTATAGADYGAIATDLQFAPGETTAVLDVPLLSDAEQELDETLILSLEALRNASAGAPRSLTITIRDRTTAVSDSSGSLSWPLLCLLALGAWMRRRSRIGD